MLEQIESLREKIDLSGEQIHEAAERLLDGNVSVEWKKDFLRALRTKGETAEEIAYFVEAFLARSLDPGLDLEQLQGTTIDVCGTGGDKLNLFNVSTTSMFVIAAGGVNVVKHGNRGITSKSGGADVLEALGIALNMPEEQFCRCVQEAGVGFLFAQKYHPAFKAVAEARAQLAQEGQGSIFNLIGPLLNPVRPETQLVGICNPQLSSTYGEILKRLGRKNAWIVHGRVAADGRSVDELSTMGNTEVIVTGLNHQAEKRMLIEPEEYGLALASVEDLEGGDAAENKLILEGVLLGKIQGAKRDIVVLNAAAGLVCAGAVPDLGLGVKKAADLIDSGAAMEKLRQLQDIGA